MNQMNPPFNIIQQFWRSNEIIRNVWAVLQHTPLRFVSGPFSCFICHWCWINQYVGKRRRGDEKVKDWPPWILRNLLLAYYFPGSSHFCEWVWTLSGSPWQLNLSLPLTDEDEEHCKRGDVPVRLEKLLGLQPGHHILELILQLLSQVFVGHCAVWSEKHTFYCSLSSIPNHLMSFVKKRKLSTSEKTRALQPLKSLVPPKKNKTNQKPKTNPPKEIKR